MWYIYIYFVSSSVRLMLCCCSILRGCLRASGPCVPPRLAAWGWLFFFLWSCWNWYMWGTALVFYVVSIEDVVDALPNHDCWNGRGEDTRHHTLLEGHFHWKAGKVSNSYHTSNEYWWQTCDKNKSGAVGMIMHAEFCYRYDGTLHCTAVLHDTVFCTTLLIIAVAVVGMM